MKTIKKIMCYILVVFALVAVVACDNGTNDGPGVVESPYGVKITAVGSVTTLKVGKTLKLRAIITNTTEKDIIWSSSDDKVATVDATGLVTAQGVGNVKIKATLKIDKNAWAEYSLTVEEALAPTAINIKGLTDGGYGWIGEGVTLTASVTPENATSTVTWSSSDSNVATIDEFGYVEFLTQGTVNITATSTLDSTVSKTITVIVKKGAFLTNIGSTNWNTAHQGDDNAYVELPDETDSQSAGFHSLYFNGVSATSFYAEATFKVTRLTSNTWTWQGFGLGSGISDNNSRFFTYSPWCQNDSNGHNKTVLRDRPEVWDALTDRSQVWGEHGLNNISINDTVKMAILRDGDNYYYLINDELHWFDVNENYSGVKTIPYIFAYDIPVKVTNFYATADTQVVNEKLNLAEMKKSFYAANSTVSYVSDSNFSFNSVEKLNKDNKVRTIGDRAKVVRNFVIEFDVDSLIFNPEKSCFRGLTINFSRYDDPNIVETIAIGKSIEQDTTGIIGRYCKWDYTSSMELSGAVSDWYETSSVVMNDQLAKHHVKIVREVDFVNEKSYFHLYIDGVEYNFDVNKAGVESLYAQVKYLGAYTIWVGGEYSSSNISNFTISSNVTLD